MTSGEQNDELLDSDDESENSCVVCYDSMETGNRSLVTLICGHRFHFACVGTYFNRIRKMECPYCRKLDPNGVWKLAPIPLSEEAEANAKFPETVEDTLGPIGCSLCNSEFDPTIKPDVVLVACGHKFHFDCLGEYCNHRNRVECPICHTLESGDWWHCPYGIHTSDVLEGSAVNNNYPPIITQRPPSAFLSTSSHVSTENAAGDSETDETMGLLEGEDLMEGEERVNHNHQRYLDGDDNEIHGCIPLLKKLMSKWAHAWTRGASGEVRLLRLFVIFILILAGDSAMRSSSLNNMKHNPNEQKEIKDRLLALYLSAAIIPMLFCPGILLLLPAILYVGLLLIKAYGHYYDTTLDLILEPIASICCLLMMLYWIKSNRLPATTDRHRPRWRPLDEVYVG
eukprot:TRINITY_DN15734_c0_g1_i2.p1 TRINITY_DN15734_c0_g1~~TRINITY_DN15734_c0_g1_i2.p1  ORF type:complete len:398 (+),score=27.07 TRINITY_DN15734_c0_g1_i2:120-1313(+)